MKLWQKIFLFTLTLVIIAVNISSMALLTNNHRLAIEREQQNALSKHNYLDLEIKNSIVYTQLIERKFSLSDDETLRVAVDVLEKQQSDTTMGASLYRDGSLVSAVNQEGIATSLDLLSEADYSSIIEEHDNKTYLYVVSTTTLSAKPYQLITSFDISSTYDLFRADFEQIRFIGVISALIVSGILLLVVRGVLSPLQNLSTTTRLIARGDLEKRAEAKGHDEVAEVAHSLNTMADSIEKNVTALEELAESRRVFISNLAHEMKTPLTSILGFADILRVKREVSEEERIEYASVIVSETKRLQELSSKLMELLFAGNLQTTLERVEVYEFISELATVIKPIVTSHSMELRVELPDEPVFILIDKELMKSFVLNLVDNSIKASRPSQAIRIVVLIVGDSIDDTQPNGDESARAKETKNEGEYVKILVVDEGVGIPADEIPLIVEPFYMLDKARTRKHGGAGLGLALCSEIACAHGSELKIRSIQGRGTAVSVLLRKEENNG